MSVICRVSTVYIIRFYNIWKSWFKYLEVAIYEYYLVVNPFTHT